MVSLMQNGKSFLFALPQSNIIFLIQLGDNWKFSCAKPHVWFGCRSTYVCLAEQNYKEFNAIRVNRLP